MHHANLPVIHADRIGTDLCKYGFYPLAKRGRTRDELDVTLVVEAAAGTGKTTELVRRILGLVRSGRATLAGLVAVTFTEKAAGEMRARLAKYASASASDTSSIRPSTRICRRW